MAKRSGIQLAYPFEERRLLNQGRFDYTWSAPWIVQPKLNGERCRMLVKDGRCLLLSSSEEIISSVSHINKEGLLFPPGEYDGELYVHGWTFSEIHSVVSREVSIHPQSGEMQLWLFDIVDEKGPECSQLYRLQRLNNILTINHSKMYYIRQVPKVVIHTLEELYSTYDKFISQGYEGFIIRDIVAHYIRRRSAAMMKFKPKATDSYLIRGVYEAISENGHPKELVGGFNCIDSEGTKFSVGAGKLTHDERRRLWQLWLDDPKWFFTKQLEIEYQTMSDKARVPLFSRALRII